MKKQIGIVLVRALLSRTAKASAPILRVAIMAVFPFLASAPQLALANIPSSDPDFSIVLFPDTQFYNSQNAYVFKDQANWVVSQTGLNIKLVIGLGDIVDGGGYPVDSYGKVNGTCGAYPPPANWQTQWQQAQGAISILNSHGIYYQPTIGNHDYDCQAVRPQPRSATNYFHYFGNLPLSPSAYILDSSGNRTPNFYKIMKIGSTNYMILSLEFLPRDWVVSAANNLISNFSGPVIVVTHAYLSYDGSGPTFGSTFPAGSAYPLCSGFPSLYGCRPDSLANYNPVGGGNDGIGLWYKLIATHPNIFMVVSGHVRNPSPGNYPSVPNYNGVGRVDCNVQSWTTLCSNPYRPIQILSDFQGQGNNGYFGYGYLRILTVSPSTKTVSVFTCSPSIANSPSNFPFGIPAWKRDSYNQYTLPFPNAFGGPDTEITHITTPHDGSHVALTFGISATASGPDIAGHMQIFVDGVQHADYPNVKALPSGAAISLSTSGTHRIAVQTYDSSRAAWVKSVIYVTNP